MLNRKMILNCHFSGQTPSLSIPPQTITSFHKCVSSQKVPSPEELKKHGAVPIVTRLYHQPSFTSQQCHHHLNVSEAQLLLDNAFYVSSEIERVTEYEKGFPGMKIKLMMITFDD